MEENHRNMDEEYGAIALASDDIDTNKLRGDSIGDNVYSERYVLKTLIQLTQYSEGKWDKEFETDLCVLWDMAVNPDVVHYLIDHDFLSLFVHVMRTSRKPHRLIEILVGMVANVCCVKESRAIVSQDQRVTTMLLGLLSFPDTRTLVQLFRCFQCFTWDLRHCDANLTTEKHWFEEQIIIGKISSSLSFILLNTLYEELLFAVVDLLNTLCSHEINDKDYARYFANKEMVKGMLECSSELFPSCGAQSSFEFSNKKLEKTAMQWVNVMMSFAGQEEGRRVLGKKAKRITSIVLNWLQVPQERNESLLISSIALLEAIVTFYFSPSAFCVMVNIVWKTTEQNIGEPSESSEGDSTVLNLRESFGNYCLEVLKNVPLTRLDSVLVEHCNTSCVRFFRDVVKEREQPPSTASQ